MTHTDGCQMACLQDVAQGIMPSWTGIVERRQREPYGEEQRQWQLLRRGRYLEFNLLYDRGVKVTAPTPCAFPGALSYHLHVPRCPLSSASLLPTPCPSHAPSSHPDAPLTPSFCNPVSLPGYSRGSNCPSCAWLQFGLDGGRVESIMVSAPPLIAWKYRAEPEEGTPEHACLEVLKSPREWV